MADDRVENEKEWDLNLAQLRAFRELLCPGRYSPVGALEREFACRLIAGAEGEVLALVRAKISTSQLDRLDTEPTVQTALLQAIRESLHKVSEVS